jgi:hypothetical protein
VDELGPGWFMAQSRENVGRLGHSSSHNMLRKDATGPRSATCGTVRYSSTRHRWPPPFSVGSSNRAPAGQ